MTDWGLFALGISVGAAAQLGVAYYLLGWRGHSTWARQEAQMVDRFAQEIQELYERDQEQRHQEQRHQEQRRGTASPPPPRELEDDKLIREMRDLHDTLGRPE